MMIANRSEFIEKFLEVFFEDQEGELEDEQIELLLNFLGKKEWNSYDQDILVDMILNTANCTEQYCKLIEFLNMFSRMRPQAVTARGRTQVSWTEVVQSWVVFPEESRPALVKAVTSAVQGHWKV